MVSDLDFSGSKLIAKFVLMNFGVTISNKVVHHFYGWSFDHATSVPILINDANRVRVRNTSNPNLDVNICAWGSSGGHRHAETREERIRRQAEERNLRHIERNWRRELEARQKAIEMFLSGK